MTEVFVFAMLILILVIFTIWYSSHSYLYADVVYLDGTDKEEGPFKSEVDFQTWFAQNSKNIHGFKAKYRFHSKSPYDKQSGSK